MFQIILSLVIFMICVIPFGQYVYHVADNKKTFADPLFNRIDKTIFWLCGVDQKEMGWKQYATGMFLTNAIMLCIGYVVLRSQAIHIFNPNGITGMDPTLAFNTIISFMTNTNLQHYAGEADLSYFSQMFVIIMMMFTSAATGYAVFVAFARGITGQKSMGNFYVDFTKVITRIFIPLSMVVGLLLVSQGVPQNLQPNVTVQTIEGKHQDIAMGPIASLASIKHIGTNGGGFLGANASTPQENPTIVTNMIQLISMMIFPGACVIAFGLMYHYRKKSVPRKRALLGAEGKSIFIAMSLLFVLGVVAIYFAEAAGNPLLERIGLSQELGSMEGKEVRFGSAQSALFSATTTAFTTGTVNNMHDTLTPLGGMVTLLNMMTNAVFGGLGVGFMNMMMYVLLTVFLCGLMIGRTPEYLGKKIESKEMKLIVLVLLLHPAFILIFSSIAVATSVGLEGITNPGFHGLSQVLYEFSSASANNGSGFEGLGDNTVFWNLTTGFVMFFARYIPIILQLAVAGALMKKVAVNHTSGTLRTNGVTFAIVVSAVVIIFAALTFFPALSLGPIAEHLNIWS